MINQFINLPTLNLADLDRLFLKISDFDAIKGFFVKISKPQFLLLKKILVPLYFIVFKEVFDYSIFKTEKKLLLNDHLFACSYLPF